MNKNVPPKKEMGLTADRNVLRAARHMRPTTTEERPIPATNMPMGVADMEAEEETAKVVVRW